VTKSYLVYPGGRPGAALLLLRLLTAGELAVATFTIGSSSIWIWLTFVTLAGLLFLGLWTRSTAAATSLLLLIVGLQFTGRVPWLDAMHCLEAACLSMLGPGRYSIDSWFFGRRVIILRG